MSRYAAFISYSHADTPTVRWLHHALETFRVPKALVGTPTPLGPAPRRLAPIFRDRDELPASGDLGTELRAALADAAFLIVICSPRSAQSHWVNEEILAFKRLHGDGRVLALIASGEPYSADTECFPPALRFKMGPGGVLTTDPAEPIAADIRPGKDGKRLAHLKLMAGLTGLKLDQLVQREAARRQRRLAYIASGAVAVAAVTLLLAFYALRQRDEARRQREMAEASLDFLVNTFSIANPATENPRTITAVTILNRVSARVEHEMKRTPEVSAKLLGVTGSIWLNLGLHKEAERDLAAALRLTPPTGEARAAILLKLAAVAFKKGDVVRTARDASAAEAAVDPESPNAALMLARVAELRGLVAYLKPDYRLAVRNYNQALQRLTGQTDEDLAAQARILMNTAEAETFIPDHVAAAMSLARARVILVSLYGREDVRTAQLIHNQAQAAFAAGRFNEAEKLISDAVAIYQKVLDPDHPLVATAQFLRGRILHSTQKLDASIKAFRQARDVFERLYGANNYQVGDTSFYLAEVLSDNSSPDLALAELGRTKRAYDASYGPLDPDQVELLDTRAQILRAAGRSAESAADCQAALRLRVRLDSHDPALPAATRRCAALAADPPGVNLLFQ